MRKLAAAAFAASFLIAGTGAAFAQSTTPSPSASPSMTASPSPTAKPVVPGGAPATGMAHQ